MIKIDIRDFDTVEVSETDKFINHKVTMTAADVKRLVNSMLVNEAYEIEHADDYDNLMTFPMSRWYEEITTGNEYTDEQYFNYVKSLE